MRPHEFIGMVARLSASGDPYGPNGDKCPNGFDHDALYSLEALDELIHKAREMQNRNNVPTKNFVVGNWSFRRSEMVEGGPGGKVRGVSFAVYPKGERSDWSVKASIYQAGECWAVHPRNGYMEAFALFEDARDRAVAIADATI